MALPFVSLVPLEDGPKDRVRVCCVADVDPAYFEKGFQAGICKIASTGLYDIRWNFRVVRPRTLVRSCLCRLVRPDLHWLKRQLGGVALEMVQEYETEDQSAFVDAVLLQNVRTVSAIYRSSQFSTTLTLQKGAWFSLKCTKVHLPPSTKTDATDPPLAAAVYPLRVEACFTKIF